MTPPGVADALLSELNDEQRAAATTVEGPVAIHAGAGTGKTRVISHRVAYAAATGAADPKRTLVVTFTEKAAAEMALRLRGLGRPDVTASTFHAAARRQLAHFWPERHDRPLPEILPSKARIIGALARQLPGHYRFTPAKDLTDEIEWAKNRRIGPDAYELAAAAEGRETPIPIDLLVRTFRRYEAQKERQGRIDFEDLLRLAVELYERDEGCIGLVRRRYAWFSVDEYQDTNPLQEALLRLWLGERRELCVVGDPDQTIYSFTGASPEYLTSFSDRYPGAHIVRLSHNYRSSPQIIAFANRLIPGRELVATRDPGVEPVVVAHSSGEAELDALVAAVRAQASMGVPHDEMAVLVRTNAQLGPIEASLTRAQLPFTVRGLRFFARPEVRDARDALRGVDGPLLVKLRDRWRTALGWEEEAIPEGGPEARDRHASLLTLMAMARELVASVSDADVAAFLADLGRRDAAEATASASGHGVTLSTIHRAKGLEWDLVLLPGLEDGTLPIRGSADDDEELAEERRLLYVAITRARRSLTLSWAAERDTLKGRRARARPSPFLRELQPGVRSSGGVARAASPISVAAVDGDLLATLKAWRLERARQDGVPAYVVADNKTLDALAVARPRTEVELRAVPGIGPSRVERYGTEILALLAGD
ncbi:MAG: ATP-dependent DNA helicase UvrD2 [Chloroflexota bacterium]